MQRTEKIKEALIKKISEETDEKKLLAAQKALEAIWGRAKQERADEILKKVAKRPKKKLDLEQLKKEQNWKPINKEEWFRKMDELNIEEPLDDLLAMLTP